MADIQVTKLVTSSIKTNSLPLPENEIVDSLSSETQTPLPIPTPKREEPMKPELFVVHDGKHVYYYTNQEYAKKQLFDVSMNYYNKEDNSEAEREEFEEEAPYLEAFKKSRYANLQMMYKLSLDIDNLLKLSSKEKCDLVNRIGIVENKKFEA
jgi:hypothetical protein